jgi:DNA-binding MarR family transcriptional regulator
MAARKEPNPRAAAPAPSDDVRAVLDAFRRIVQALRGDHGAANGRARLSSAQLFALQRLAEHPGASINDLAALTFTHQSSVSVVVQRLVRRRLVAKITARDDRRRHQLALRADGRRLLRRAPAAVQQRLIAAVAELPATDRRALARTLGTLAHSVVPPNVTVHPPMFFEDASRDMRAPRAPSTGRRKTGPKR